MYKLFISHATEDKTEVARPLVELLISKGVSVWYDEYELKLGDSLRKSIDKGLRESDFGIVILSPAFFNKNWTQYEIDSLVTLEMAYSRKIILPVWHNVSLKDVIKFSPNLGDKIAAVTKIGLENVANKILEVLNFTQNSSLLHYDLNEDDSIRLHWGLFNTARKFNNIQFDNEKYLWHLTAENNESVGINLHYLPLSGKISFEYMIEEMQNSHINIMFYLIPIKKKQQIVEVGFIHPVDPENPFSFYRQRIRPKIKKNIWIDDIIDFDFLDLVEADYIIFAPRINEGCPFTGPAKLLIKNVTVNKKN